MGAGGETDPHSLEQHAQSACGPWSSRTRTGTSGSVFPDQAETVHSEQRLTPTAAQVEGRTRGDGVRIPLIPTEEERSQS
ncbi:hypothetical protein JOB18_028455 [Solea senegalensis]|uniref:Uncharacterized protein n=1 Tax=Solea senegalensis TaxID=28829 RepID=A0AAV6QD48_SOLSE|nr:hypothetical protein JOB18_028455 [Solea senegalensis]